MYTYMCVYVCVCAHAYKLNSYFDMEKTKFPRFN